MHWAAVQFLVQANHTIYDYGSFGFWGAVLAGDGLAGGSVMVADGYRWLEDSARIN